VTFNINRKLAIGAAAAAAAAFAGGAYAATRDSGSSGQQAFLNDVAKRLHVSPQELAKAYQGAAIDQIQAAVAAGKLSQAQADRLKRAIENHAAGPGVMPAAPPFFPGPGPHLWPHPRADVTDTAARYLGLSESQLRDDLVSGKSLAQIAKARGKSTSGLKAAMLAALKANLDGAVKNKLITSSQEKAMLDRASARLDDLINRTSPRFGLHRAGSGGSWQPGPNDGPVGGGLAAPPEAAPGAPSPGAPPPGAPPPEAPAPGAPPPVPGLST
jgi:hypothetical protein